VTSGPTVQRRPVEPLDENVSGATLVDWSAWAASTTFSSTGRRFGYLRAIRDTFLGVSQPPVRADSVRGKQFPSTNDEFGYDKTQVDAFLDAARIRLSAMEATDTLTGPLASDAFRADWAEWADSTTFSTTAHRSQGYATAEASEACAYSRATMRWPKSWSSAVCLPCVSSRRLHCWDGLTP
jgi:DivIVA domain-containing protein